MKKHFGVLLCCLFLFSLQTSAQSFSPFVSPEDKDLTVKSVTAMPFTDNIKSIYAKPLFKKFQELLANDKSWTYEAAPESTSIPLNLDEDPSTVKSLMNQTQAQGLFTMRLTRGPKGLNGKLLFFVGSSGLPFLQEELTDYQGFEIADLEKQLTAMYERIKARMPYRGLVLSRRAQEVTINLGSKNGIKNNDEISVIQILKIQRHPKLHFLINTEKTIIGKVKIFKTDEYLSFGHVIFEREPGTIQVSSKLLPQDFIHYNAPVLQDGRVVPGLENRSDRDLSYGSNPQEWLPQSPPQYGRIAILAGFGNYNHSTSLSPSSIDASSSFTPEIAIKGELWLSSQWNIVYGLRQSVFNTKNPLSGSTPATLNMSLSSYNVLGAYNFLMSGDFFGPKIQISAGYSSYDFHTDQSTPLAFTNMKYSGLVVGVLGQFPLSEEIPMDLGAQFNMFLSSGLSESVASGDSSDNSIRQFGFFGVYHLKSRFKIRGEVNFEYYSSDFSGAGTGTHTSSNTTQRLTSFMGGIEYLF